MDGNDRVGVEPKPMRRGSLLDISWGTGTVVVAVIFGGERTSSQVDFAAGGGIGRRLRGRAGTAPRPLTVILIAAVTVARDWLDYVAAFAGVGSLALAAVAAIVAIRSKADAERSATAAEQTAKAAAATTELTAQMERRGAEQLEIMRTEHWAFMAEQNRQPNVLPILEK